MAIIFISHSKKDEDSCAYNENTAREHGAYTNN